MNQDHLFLRACRGETTERTPIWIMRQAGRYLPEYRAIREQTDFLTLCKTPDWAAEVTVQPIDIIGVDAAILFSDILVIPEAMGMKLELIESRGPVFDDPLRKASDVERLKTENLLEKLDYVFQAIRLTKERLDNRVPLIGFSGAPWTLATYMVEGKGAKNFDIVKSLIYREPATAHLLLQKLSDAVIEYLNQKIRAGCDAVQIFDTWAGNLSPADFAEFSLPYLKYICERLETRGAPVIVFAKGVSDMQSLADLKCDVLGVDWTKDIGKIKRQVGDKKVLQGNLDPCVLFAPPEKIRAETERILRHFENGRGHVFNLGHGILPQTAPENARFLVDSVKEISSGLRQNEAFSAAERN